MTEQSVLSAAISLLTAHVPALKTVVDANERRAGGAAGSAIVPDEVPIVLVLPGDVAEDTLAYRMQQRTFDLELHLVHYYPNEVGTADDFRDTLVAPIEQLFRTYPQLNLLADTATTQLLVCGAGPRGIRTKTYGYWTGSQYARQAQISVQMRDLVRG